MLHDDYLSCGQYQNQPKHTTEANFVSFVDVKSGKYFFALVDLAGDVLLRSEGYESEKSRENGIKSVLTNMPVEKRYAVTTEKGQYFVSLKAANHREIAISCPLTTEAEAKAFIVRMSSANRFASAKGSAASTVKEVKPADPKATVTKSGSVDKTVKATAPKATPAPKAAVVKVEKAAPVAKVAKVAAPKATPAPKAAVVKVEKAAPVAKVAKAAAPKATPAPIAAVVKVEKAAPVVTEVKVLSPKTATTTSKPTATATSKSVVVEKATSEAQYKNEGFYLGHETLLFGQVQTGYTKFIGQDDHFYFAVYNPDGSLYLASADFQNEAERDEAFISVVRTIENPACYNITEDQGSYFSVLVDLIGNEIARSAAYNTFTEAFKTTPNGRVRAEVTLY